MISNLIFALTLFLSRRFSAFSISNGFNYFHPALLITFVAIKSPLQIVEIFFIVRSVNDCMEMYQKCYFKIKINVSCLSIALFNWTPKSYVFFPHYFTSRQCYLGSKCLFGLPFVASIELNTAWLLLLSERSPSSLRYLLNILSNQLGYEHSQILIQFLKMIQINVWKDKHSHCHNTMLLPLKAVVTIVAAYLSKIWECQEPLAKLCLLCSTETGIASKKKKSPLSDNAHDDENSVSIEIIWNFSLINYECQEHRLDLKQVFKKHPLKSCINIVSW